MIYMSSQSTGDGKLTITVTFRIGTDLNVAQMLTQNRVQDALPRLPDDVQRLGVQVRKATPNILLAVHLFSPDGSRDNLYLSNYATLHVKDALARLPGVGDVQLFGARDYAMRIWLDPDKVAAYNLNAGEVLAALRAQNVQVSAGVLNQPPVSGRRGVSAQRADARPPEHARAVRRHHPQDRCTGAPDPHPRRRPRRGRRGRLRINRLHGPQPRACRC
jgi:multidrug efflux pump subunit AcrB